MLDTRRAHPPIAPATTLGGRATNQSFEQRFHVAAPGTSSAGLDDPLTALKKQVLGGNYKAPVTSGPTSKLPEPESTEPTYKESAHSASYRIRVVAHASPRWQGAHNAKQADELNLELSKLRARNVGAEVERRLAKLLPTGSTTSVEASAALDENTIGIAETARGSRDTLKEAHGNRRDNARDRRRVNIYISSTQNVSGEAGASKPLEYLSTASKFWHIGVNVSASAGETVGGSFLAAVLTNDATGESMSAHVIGISEGFSGPFPASVALSFSDATGFSTRKPMNFQDFQNTPVIYNNVGVSFFIGYSRSYITFPLKRTEPLDINVSGVTTGSPGIDASSTQGVFRFDSDSFPPTQVPIKDSDLTTQSYARTDKGEAEWTVFFETEVDNLDERRDLTELALLDSFLASVVASQR